MRIGLVVICVAACGNDDRGGGGFAAIDQLDAAYHATICPHLVTCGEFPDQATCLMANVGPFPLSLDPMISNGDVAAAVIAGKVIYDGNKMQQCLDAVAGGTCDPTAQSNRVTPLVCAETLRGTVAAGGACQLSIECVSQTCMQQCGQQPGCCPGTCVGDTPPIPHMIALGQSCAFGSVGSCIAGSFCTPSTEICVPLEAAGSSCFETSQCDYGLACAGQSTLTCQPLPTLGEPCPAFQCRDEGTVCSNTTVTCVAVGLDGAPCVSSGDCSPYYQCDQTTHACTPNPRLGQSCSTTQTCFDAGTYCDSVTSICTTLAPNGQPCSSGQQCSSGSCIIVDTVGTCTESTHCN